jgi:hypothetical protein
MEKIRKLYQPLLNKALQFLGTIQLVMSEELFIVTAFIYGWSCLHWKGDFLQ